MTIRVLCILILFCFSKSLVAQATRDDSLTLNDQVNQNFKNWLEKQKPEIEVSHFVNGGKASVRENVSIEFSLDRVVTVGNSNKNIPLKDISSNGLLLYKVKVGNIVLQSDTVKVSFFKYGGTITIGLITNLQEKLDRVDDTMAGNWNMLPDTAYDYILYRVKQQRFKYVGANSLVYIVSRTNSDPHGGFALQIACK
jgi:hypothetical protein